jgi:hypothetical protein
MRARHKYHLPRALCHDSLPQCPRLHSSGLALLRLVRPLEQHREHRVFHPSMPVGPRRGAVLPHEQRVPERHVHRPSLSLAAEARHHPAGPRALRGCSFRLCSLLGGAGVPRASLPAPYRGLVLSTPAKTAFYARSPQRCARPLCALADESDERKGPLTSIGMTSRVSCAGQVPPSPAGWAVAPSEAGNLWAREVGVAILSIGVTTFLLKGEGDSPALQAFLVGNAILQIGLFPIEIIAYAKGVVTKISGIAPNSVLHLVLASGFVYFATRIKKRGGRFSSATAGPPTE